MSHESSPTQWPIHKILKTTHKGVNEINGTCSMITPSNSNSEVSGGLPNRDTDIPIDSEVNVSNCTCDVITSLPYVYCATIFRRCLGMLYFNVYHTTLKH